jgi:hypothetical protein
MDAGREVLFDARLVEECVLLAEARQEGLLRLRLRRERDALYEAGDPEDRERRFEQLHRRWFERMALGSPLLALLDGRAPTVQRCVVVPAATADEEGADLRDERPLDDAGVVEARPTLILQMRPQTLIDAAGLGRLLEHEILHVEDMLDPAFGYRCDRLPAPNGPGASRRATDRYRVLWDCSIDGRLHRLGRVGDDILERRRREFAAAFPAAEHETDGGFRRWFEGPRPTHDALLAACAANAGSASGYCPLCRFPSPRLEGGDAVDAAVARRIREGFPDWEPAAGACRQCLDLYAAQAEVTQLSASLIQ